MSAILLFPIFFRHEKPRMQQENTIICECVYNQWTWLLQHHLYAEYDNWKFPGSFRILPTEQTIETVYATDEFLFLHDTKCFLPNII